MTRTGLDYDTTIVGPAPERLFFREFPIAYARGEFSGDNCLSNEAVVRRKEIPCRREPWECRSLRGVGG